MLSIKSLTINKIKNYWKNLGKELFPKQRFYKEKIEYNDDMKNNEEDKHAVKENVIIIKECEDINDNNNNEIPGNNSNNNNLLSLKMTQQSFGNNLKNLSFSNDKFISFGKNSVIRKSFQNDNTKKYRGSFSFTMNTNNKGEKNRPKKTFSTQCARFINNNKNSLMKLSSVYQSKLKSSVISKNKLSSQISRRSIQNLRINYLKKLKTKIKNLKKTKKYYKDLCKQLTNPNRIKENEILEKFNVNNTFDSFDKKNIIVILIKERMIIFHLKYAFQEIQVRQAHIQKQKHLI